MTNFVEIHVAYPFNGNTVYVIHDKLVLFHLLLWNRVIANNNVISSLSTSNSSYFFRNIAIAEITIKRDNATQPKTVKNKYRPTQCFIHSSHFNKIFILTHFLQFVRTNSTSLPEQNTQGC